MMTFTVVSDNDNIIVSNKWHFNRFLNQCLFDWNKIETRLIDERFVSVMGVCVI
jgi:hypothetical protein